MSYRKIHAYVRCNHVQAVEQALLDLGIDSFSFCRVKGTGEYVNYYRHDHLVEHARLEIFVPEKKVTRAVEAIMDAASTHTPGDGVIAVMPVTRFYSIRNRAVLDDGSA